MQGINLHIPESAQEALDQETDFPFDGRTLFENEIDRVLMYWADEGDDESFIPREHVEILSQTGVMPVESLVNFARLFHNIGVEWTEDGMRNQGIGEPTEDSEASYKVAEAWYDLSRSVHESKDVLDRVVEVRQVVSYETQPVQQ